MTAIRQLVGNGAAARIASGTGRKQSVGCVRLNPKARHSNEPPAAVFECDDLSTGSDGSARDRWEQACGSIGLRGSTRIRVS
jgi:hypothetical protein